MTNSFISFSRFNFLALVLSFDIFKPAVSSIYNGFPDNIVDVNVKRSNSLPSNFPSLMLFESIKPYRLNNLLVSCSDDISSEKIATGTFFLAKLAKILSAKAVFPILGLAPKMIKSDFCKPPVILLSSLNPVSRPNNLPS